MDWGSGEGPGLASQHPSSPVFTLHLPAVVQSEGFAFI